MTHYAQGMQYDNGTPNFEVSVGFGVSPLDHVYLATDISQYVRAISVTRGKTDDLQDFSAGQATVTLDNRDRRFDPSYADGPYFGQLVPRCPIQIKGHADSLEQNIFAGFISGWPQSFGEYGIDATCVIECYDLTAVMSQIDLPDDPSKGVILSLSIDDPSVRYFRFGDFTRQADVVYDLTHSTNAYCSLGAGGGVIPTTVSHVGPELSPELNGTSSYFPGPYVNPSYRTQVVNAVTITPSNQSIVFGGWISIAPSSTNFGGLTSGAIVTVGEFQVGLDAAGRIALYKASGVLIADSNTIVDDGVSRHIMFYYNGSTYTPQIYINGLNDTRFTATSGPVLSSDRIIFDSLYYTFYVQEWVFFLSYYSTPVINWNSETPSFYARIMYGAGINQALMSTYDRFYLVSTLSSFDIGDFLNTDPEADYLGQCLELNFAGKTLLQSLQDVARTEQGFLFTTNNGKLKFHSRYAVAESLIGLPKITFTDDPDLLPTYREDPLGNYYIGYNNFGFEFDDTQLANFTQVSLGGGNQGSYGDAPSVIAVGKKSLTVDTLLSSLSDAYDMSEALTNIYKDPILRIKEMTVFPQTVGQARQLLALELGDLVAVERLPQGIGWWILKSLTVLQIKHDITPDKWSVSVYASERPVNSFFILGGYSSPLDSFTNLVGYQNYPDSNNWTATGGVKADETGIGRRTLDCVSLTKTSGTAAMSLLHGNATRATVVAGIEYEGFLHFKSNTDGKTVRLEIVWYNSGGTIISTTVSASSGTTSSSAGWQRLEITATAPAGAVKAGMKFNAIDTHTVGDKYFITDVLLHASSEGYTDYFSVQQDILNRYTFGGRINFLQDGNYLNPLSAYTSYASTSYVPSPVTTTMAVEQIGNENYYVTVIDTTATKAPLIKLENNYIYDIDNRFSQSVPFRAQVDICYDGVIYDGTESFQLVAVFRNASNAVISTVVGEEVFADNFVQTILVNGFIDSSAHSINLEIWLNAAEINTTIYVTNFLMEMPLDDDGNIYAGYPNYPVSWFNSSDGDSQYPYRVTSYSVSASAPYAGTISLGDLNDYYDGSALDGTDILGF